MANNVTNIIELRGKQERVQELLESIANEEYGSGSISFEKIIPMPGDLYMGEIPRDGPKPYGQNNWLDWSRANWGPKWDAYGFGNRPNHQRCERTEIRQCQDCKGHHQRRQQGRLALRGEELQRYGDRKLCDRCHRCDCPAPVTVVSGCTVWWVSC